MAIAVTLYRMGDQAPAPKSDPAVRTEGRARVRHVLARHVAAHIDGGPETRLRFAPLPNGAPTLLVNDDTWPISVTHTHQLIGIATAKDAVGVDVERTDRLDSNRGLAMRLAARLWPTSLSQWLALQPAARQPTIFVRLWTLFEARAKRWQTGMWRTSFQLSLEQLAAVAAAADGATFSWLPRSAVDEDEWALSALPQGYTLALCAQRKSNIALQWIDAAEEPACLASRHGSPQSA